MATRRATRTGHRGYSAAGCSRVNKTASAETVINRSHDVPVGTTRSRPRLRDRLVHALNTFVTLPSGLASQGSVGEKQIVQHAFDEAWCKGHLEEMKHRWASPVHRRSIWCPDLVFWWMFVFFSVYFPSCGVAGMAVDFLPPGRLFIISRALWPTLFMSLLQTLFHLVFGWAFFRVPFLRLFCVDNRKSRRMQNIKNTLIVQ